MKTSHYFARILTSCFILLALSAASCECFAEDSDVYLISNGDFNTGANWDDGLVPSLAFDPPQPVPNIYGIDDGHSATFSGGTTRVYGLRVGSGAKEHYVGSLSDTHFGKLTMTGGTLEVIGSAANGLFGVGRERQNKLIGADYNKDSLVDAADYTVWRNTLGASTGCGTAANPTLAGCGDGSGATFGDPDGTVDEFDYTYWKASYGNVVKGGEIIMTGTSAITANGIIVGERTKGLLSIGPTAVAEFRTWIPATTVEPIVPAHFGGTEDFRIGGFGPGAEVFLQPGMDGNGLIDVQGTLLAKTVLISEHGSKGELRLSGGSITLHGALDIRRCDGCYTLPAESDPDYALIQSLLAQRSAKVSIVGSDGTFNVGADPDPMVVDPMPPSRDILANSATAYFSFTADEGGVTPITIVENVGEISGTAYINTAKLVLDLDDYLDSDPLTLINAPAGQLVGEFGSVTFLGSRTATVSYGAPNCGSGNVCLINFVGGPGGGGLASAEVPEPSSAMLLLTLGLALYTLGAETYRRRICLRGYPCLITSP